MLIFVWSTMGPVLAFYPFIYNFLHQWEGAMCNVISRARVEQQNHIWFHSLLHRVKSCALKIPGVLTSENSSQYPDMAALFLACCLLERLSTNWQRTRRMSSWLTPNLLHRQPPLLHQILHPFYTHAHTDVTVASDQCYTMAVYLEPLSNLIFPSSRIKTAKRNIWH